MRDWLSWVFVVLGIWLIISPWVVGFSGEVGATWNAIIVGIIVAALGLYSYFGLARETPGGRL